MAPDPKMYQVNEMFHTIQGEGHWMGVPATFIRLQGCSVGCPWCDTKYTWYHGGTRMNVDDIVPQIQHKHVVITGGEPTIWPLDELIHSIRSFTNGLVYIQMESSGQKKLRGNLTPDWITWSPKRNLDFMAPPEFMILVDEVKFVVDAEFSFADVDPVLKNLTALDSMMQTISFMAEGCPPTPDSLQKAMEFAKEYDGAAKKVMACDRLQYRMEVK